MESFLSRYRNLVVLGAVLLAQLIGLAVQVRRPDPNSFTGLASRTGLVSLTGTHSKASVPLIRLWAAALVTPSERAIHGLTAGSAAFWSNYVALRGVRKQNADLRQTIDRLRLEQASLIEDARQGQRLQALLKFQESYIYKTTAAQVIGTSGSTLTHVVFLDKGSADGLAVDMAVITPDGIVGKVRTVFEHTAQVLLVNDQTSGAGVVLETTRIRGILRGNASGQPQIVDILADDRIKPGERAVTAGGDQIFPRGLAVGTVVRVDRDPDRGSFIDVVLKPAADLQHLDEVLVITQLASQLSPTEQADVDASVAQKGTEAAAAEAARRKTTQELAERLPSLTETAAQTGTQAAGTPAAANPASPANPASQPNQPNAAPSGQPGALPTLPPAKPIPPRHQDRYSPSAGGSGTAPSPQSSNHQEEMQDRDSHEQQPAASGSQSPGRQRARRA